MKKLLTTCLLASVIGAGTSTYAAFSISGDMSFATEYVFRGVKLADDTFHPSVEASYEGLYLGIWGALPTENIQSMGYTNEWDGYVGYSYDVDDKTSLDFGITYYYYPDSLIDETWEPYVGVNWTLDSWTPSVYVYYDLDLETWTFQGSVGYSIPLEKSGMSLDLSATYGYVDPNGGGGYSYYGAQAKVPYTLNETTTLYAALDWATNTIDGAEDNMVYFTVGVSFN